MEKKTKKTGGERIVFLTGATGHVGRNLLSKLLLSDGGTRVIVLIRGESDQEVEDRLENLLVSLAPVVDPMAVRPRLQAVRGDITSDRLGISAERYQEIARQITHLIHSAATVHFRTPLQEARAINVEGTKRVMALARLAHARGRLEGAAHISTAFVCGNRGGRIREEELARRRKFSNTYEQTKFEAEMFLRRFCRDLPLIIFRPSIIVGDSRTGATSAFNVLYIPLKCLARGWVRFVPGRPATPLDIVPVDFVCAAICHILFQTEKAGGQTYHLCAGREKATSVGVVTDLALDYFRKMMPRRRYPRIRFISAKWLSALRLIEPLLSRPMRNVNRKWRTYVPYLDILRFFDTSAAEAALRNSGIAPPPFEDYYKILLRYCLWMNWGETQARDRHGDYHPLPQPRTV